MAPAPWKREPYDTEPARFNDYAAQGSPSKKRNDLRATNNTEYAYYLGPDFSQPKVEQDYRHPSWARETQRPYWSKVDPTRGLYYAQPISTTSECNPSICRAEYYQWCTNSRVCFRAINHLYIMPLSHFPTLREIQLRYKASAKQYKIFASCMDPSRNTG